MAEDPSQAGLVSDEEDLGGKLVELYVADYAEEEDSMVKTVYEESNKMTEEGNEEKGEKEQVSKSLGVEQN